VTEILDPAYRVRLKRPQHLGGWIPGLRVALFNRAKGASPSFPRSTCRQDRLCF